MKHLLCAAGCFTVTVLGLLLAYYILKDQSAYLLLWKVVKVTLLIAIAINAVIFGFIGYAFLYLLIHVEGDKDGK